MEYVKAVGSYGHGRCWAAVGEVGLGLLRAVLIPISDATTRESGSYWPASGAPGASCIFM